MGTASTTPWTPRTCTIHGPKHPTSSSSMTAPQDTHPRDTGDGPACLQAPLSTVRGRCSTEQGTLPRAGYVLTGEHGWCKAATTAPSIRASRRLRSMVYCSNNCADTWKGEPRHSPLVRGAISFPALPVFPSGGCILSPGGGRRGGSSAGHPHHYPHPHGWRGRKVGGNNVSQQQETQRWSSQALASTSPEKHIQNKAFYGSFGFIWRVFLP